MLDGQVFSGVRVVELAQFVFVPAAGALLADHGAEVIHVELVGGGDPYRTLQVGDGREKRAVNLSMEQNNRGKKSIAIELKSAEGREVFLKLIETADVFLTSLRPKAIDALGLGIEELRARNPKLIYARGNGLGFQGRELNKAGYDATAFWCRGGFADILRPRDRDQPLLPRPALGDHLGAVSVAYGIAGALFRRAMTGEPTVVDISLLATAVWALSSDIVASQQRTPEQLTDYGDPRRAPLRFAYRTRDGRYVQLMFLEAQRYWQPLCRLIEREDLLADTRFDSDRGRAEHGPEIVEQIQAAIGAKDWAGHWQARFDAWDAPWELVRTIHEVARDPQAEANGYLFDVELEPGTRITLASGPASFDGRAAPIDPRPAPALGEHSDALLAGIGYSTDELSDLRARGAIR